MINIFICFLNGLSEISAKRKKEKNFHTKEKGLGSIIYLTFNSFWCVISIIRVLIEQLITITLIID